jgi:hypothetical protein
LLGEIERHRKADQIIKGTYGEENGTWKGCAVGCSIHSINILKGKEYETNDHHIYETQLGIPEWLAKVEDTIFEGLPTEDAMLWPEQFTRAVPVGVDSKKLEFVKWKFCLVLLKENYDQVKGLDITEELKNQVLEAIDEVRKVHQTAVDTGKWDESAASSAASSAAESAAWSARSAAWSARSAASSAAWSAWSAARSAAYKRYADVLTDLLEHSND